MTRTFSDDKLLKTKQAAQLLDCSLSKIHNLIKNGELPALKVGRVKKVWMSDVSDYTRKHMTDFISPNN